MESILQFCLTSSLILLDDNNMSGTIPSEIGEMSSLNYIIMSKRRQTSFICLFIRCLFSNFLLLWISTDENLLTGTIPSQLGELQNLIYLWISKYFVVMLHAAVFWYVVGLFSSIFLIHMFVVVL